VPLYLVSLRGKLSGGAIVHLEEKGMYRGAEEVSGLGSLDGEPRHLLEIEASKPEDAILVARGALAVAGATAHDYEAEETSPGG
jgi:hypothetical protein